MKIFNMRFSFCFIFNIFKLITTMKQVQFNGEKKLALNLLLIRLTVRFEMIVYGALVVRLYMDLK